MLRRFFITLFAIVSYVNARGQEPVLLKDISATGNTFTSNFVELNGATVFLAQDDVHGIELWFTDGTTGGTNILEINPGTVNFGNGIPDALVAQTFKCRLNSKIYFVATPNGFTERIWATDGTIAGTVEMPGVPTTLTDIRNLTAFNNKIYFTGTDATNGAELWVYDGVFASMVTDINPGTGPSTPTNFIVYNNQLFFSATDIVHGFELWVSDGTGAGTSLFTDIFTSAVPGNPGINASSSPTQFTIANNLLFFAAQDERGKELWVTDGTLAGTKLVKDINTNINAPGFTESSSPNYLFAANNKLFFCASENASFPAFYDWLYVTDGTDAGTILLKSINVGGDLNRYGIGAVYNNLLYIVGDDGLHGNEMWVTNGTPSGTALFKDLNTHVGTESDVRDLTVYNNKLYFTGNTEDVGNVAMQLYATDGSPANIEIIAPAFVDNPSPYFGGLSVANGSLFFNAGYSNAIGYEPYKLGIGNTGIVWTGNTSGNWFTASNWEPQQIPSDTDNVVIPNGTNLTPPFLTRGNAECKNLKIESNAGLYMTGGTLNVYGEVTLVTNQNLITTGGTIKLYRGSVFPDDMTFYNLTIISLNNNVSENTYTLPGEVTFYGDLVIKGTAAGNDYKVPQIIMEENNNFNVLANLVIDQGQIGIDVNNLPLADNTNMPGFNFSGPGVQTFKMNNYDPTFEGAIANCNVIINNPSVKLINTHFDLAFANLIVNKDFNLVGNSIYTFGKIIYDLGASPIPKILNARPNQGSLVIQNDPNFNYDDEFQYVNADRLRYLEFASDGSGITNDTIIIYNDLSVDSLLVNGYLRLNGASLTIGSVKRSTGFLDCKLMGNEFAVGTLSLLGNSICPRYKLVADALNNLTLNNPLGVELNNATNLDNTHPSYGKMKLYGTAKLASGDFDLMGSQISLVQDTGINFINMGKIMETPNNTFTSSVATQSAFIYIDTIVSTPLSSMNFGGLGFIITCSTPINRIFIQRTPTSTFGSNAGTSINRIYTVINQTGGSGLNARIKIKYDDSELLGLNESDLAIYRQDLLEPGNIWHLVPSTVNAINNTVTSTVDLSQIDFSNGGFTYYTLGSASTPLRKASAFPKEAVANTTKITAYPNPFSNSISASLTSIIKEDATIQVTDISGRIVHTSLVQLTEGENIVNVCCMENAPDGIYFMQINSATQNNVIRIIKHK